MNKLIDCDNSESDFTRDDLENCDGIKIKGISDVCYLHRFNADDSEYYWARCRLIHRTRIKEELILSEEELLNVLNKKEFVYILIK